MTQHESTDTVMSASTVTGDMVRNMKGEDLGRIEDVMIDLGSGQVAYAVLVAGEFFGLGGHYIAVPWKALAVDLEQREFILDMDKARLEQAPAFDEDSWPAMNDRQWAETVHGFYGSRPYWEAQASRVRPA